MPIPKYVSAEEYSRQSGIGVEEVKRLCRTNQLKHFMTEGGYYKIAVDDVSIPKEEYSIENIKSKILSRDFVNYEEVIPYKIIPDKTFKTKSNFKKIYKPKGIIALYYYYKHLLGLYPKYNQSYRLTPEMRADIRKMDMYSEQIRFMCKYKLETLNNIDNLKDDKKEELKKYINCRNRLYYKRKNLKEDDEKELVTKQIIAVTSEIEKIRKEIRMCDVIYDNSIKMKENNKEMEERENTKENEKTKKRKYER